MSESKSKGADNKALFLLEEVIIIWVQELEIIQSG